MLRARDPGTFKYCSLIQHLNLPRRFALLYHLAPQVDGWRLSIPSPALPPNSASRYGDSRQRIEFSESEKHSMTTKVTGLPPQYQL